MKRLLIPPDKVSAVRQTLRERALRYDAEMLSARPGSKRIRVLVDMAAFFHLLVRQLDRAGGGGK